MLAYYVHNLSPFALQFGRSASGQAWGIRWYGISYMLGFIAAYFLVAKLAKEGILRMPAERVPDLVLNVCIWGVLVGGRLGHVFFYEPSLLWNFSDGFPFWGVLKVWQGGMSAHGGVIGVVITLMVFGRRHRYSVINLGDACCMIVPIGLMFGRMGNFINGELYGHPTTLPWAVQFPTELSAPTNGIVDPALQVQLPAVAQAVQAQIDLVSDRLRLGDITLRSDVDLVTLLQTPRDILGKAMPAVDLHSISEFTRVQFAAILPPRHPSQLYESFFEGVVLFLICWTIGRFWRKDGMASGAFLTFYPIMRIIGEQFRIGDEPPAWLAWTHQSEGVLLSVLMFIIGAAYWGYFIRRPALLPQAPVVTEPAG